MSGGAYHPYDREMFTKTARFYDLAYGFKDYAEEAALVSDAILTRCPQARTLLDVACGTGKHLEQLRERFAVEGVDLDEELLSVARGRLPGVALHAGDMRAFALGRTFDAVTCLFSSIAYMTTADGLAAAISNLSAHVAPGGVLVVEPFIGPDEWSDGHTSLLTADDGDVRLARGTITHRNGRVAHLDFHYLVIEPDGAQTFFERHEIGLFTPAEYRAAFDAAGFHVEHDPVGPIGRGLYVATPA